MKDILLTTGFLLWILALSGCINNSSPPVQSAEGDVSVIDEEIISEEPGLQDAVQEILHPEPQTPEEVNLVLSDFPSGFEFNDLVSGSQKDAIAYADGNKEQAEKLVAKGWLENHAAGFLRRSQTQEVAGTKIVIEDYVSKISLYKVTDSFEDAISQYEIDFSEKYTIIPTSLGDYSFLGKITETTLLGPRTYYVGRFTKGDFFVNFNASGTPTQIDDEKVLEYMEKIANRIR